MTLMVLLTEDRVAMAIGSDSFTGESDRSAIGEPKPSPGSPAGDR